MSELLFAFIQFLYKKVLFFITGAPSLNFGRDDKGVYALVLYRFGVYYITPMSKANIIKIRWHLNQWLQEMEKEEQGSAEVLDTTEVS